jgi:hypothetical protein
LSPPRRSRNSCRMSASRCCWPLATPLSFSTSGSSARPPT